MRKHTCTVNMDMKQRICLTRVLSKEEREEFNSFRMCRDGGKIVLEPIAEVPPKGHRIYNNPDALHSLMKGIKDAEEGKLFDLGSFAKYANEDGDE